ncbi:PepSY domain-containing protein [Aquicoccus sp. G2-2]|uniref:PepSY domain-containing protein n=1 Tax=Aquicoccus sp. G2-2 TaxID=3092120 RepID=UPI002ADF382A|nr:hypothetical protein [Aquicoccus sp. G2-2]MEA1113905.1 hypothetical protein [Aquicoccus sp. G2-2]
MKRNAILTLGTGALISLGLLGGAASMASAGTSATEAQAFLTAPGSLSAAVSAAEKSTGGKAMSADFEEDGANTGMYDVEIVMSDGTVSDHLVNPADNSVKAAPADKDHEENEND